MSENYNQKSNANSKNSTKRKIGFSEKPHELSNIKKVIGIVSGKGGVGKSLDNIAEILEKKL